MKKSPELYVFGLLMILVGVFIMVNPWNVFGSTTMMSFGLVVFLVGFVAMLLSIATG
jgi:hypothetical protein